jgi:hypothetical protein
MWIRAFLNLAATAGVRSRRNLVQENHTGAFCNRAGLISHCTANVTP